MAPCGFVIVRHVNAPIINQYWQIAYQSIRKYYDWPILIVDDNSVPEYLACEIELVNCTVVEGGHPKVGEFLGYYWFHQLHPFDKAIIIHDSVFINQCVPFENVEECQFLWHFAPYIFDRTEHVQEILKLFPQAADLLRFYITMDWVGCFGVMAVITWDFLHTLNNEYNLFATLLPITQDRMSRCDVEQVFAIICHHKTPKLSTNPMHAILGNIHAYCPWDTHFDVYLAGRLNHLPVIKVWTGR